MGSAMTYLLVLLGAGRFILMLISIKYPKVSKLYFLYENVMLMVEMSLPVDYGSSRREHFFRRSEEL